MTNGTARQQRKTTPGKTMLTLVAGLVILTMTACGGSDANTANPETDRRAESSQRQPTATRETAAAAQATTRPNTDAPATPAMADAKSASGNAAEAQTTAETQSRNPEGSGRSAEGSEKGAATPAPTDAGDSNQQTTAGFDHLSFGASLFTGGHRKSNRVIYHMDQALAENPNSGDAYALRGLAHAFQRKFDKALADFDQALATGVTEVGERQEQVAKAYRRSMRDGNQTGLDNQQLTEAMRAYVLTRLGRHDEALDTLQPLTEWDHYFSGTLLALVHYNLGNYREAEETCCLPLYELQIRIDSGFGQYSGLNRQPGIDVDLKLNPDNVKAIRDRQKLHSDFGELEKALQDLLRARELSDTKQRSSTISYYYLMGQHDQLAEEASLLIADLEQSAAQDKEKRQATAHSYRAGAYTATGQYEQAAKDYVEVLSIIRSMEEQGVDTQYLRSRGYRANYMLGLFKIVNGDIQGGFAHLCSPDGTCDYAYAATENLFNLDAAENAHMHLYRGTAQCSVNAEEQYDCIGYHPEGRISSHTTPNHVLFDFNRALELDPTLDEARLWRAIAHSMVHGPEDPLTIQYYAEAMDLHPNDPGLLDLRAEQYAVANNFPAAIADLTSMIEIRPEKGADLHFRRATYHQQNRDKQAAEADYLKALELGYDQDKIRQAIIDLTG